VATEGLVLICATDTQTELRMDPEDVAAALVTLA